MHLPVSSVTRFVRYTLIVTATLALGFIGSGALTAQQPGDLNAGIAQPAPGAARVQVLIEMKEDSAAAVYAGVIDRAPAVTRVLEQTAAQAAAAQVQRVVAQQQQVTSTIAIGRSTSLSSQSTSSRRWMITSRGGSDTASPARAIA